MDWDPELDVTLSNGRRVLTFQIAAIAGAREAWAILEPEALRRVTLGRAAACYAGLNGVAWRRTDRATDAG